MGTFPLPILPTAPWRHLKKSQNVYFGAPRDAPFPVHGACDLLAPAGTNVLAMQHGVILWKYQFVEYKTIDKTTKEVTCDKWTWAMEVQHDDFIVRYSEISPHFPNGIIEGKEVNEGDVIATVGAQCGGTMLHFEMFRDRGRLSSRNECWADTSACLTNKSHATKYANVPQANYERRDDLLDPTPYLDEWSRALRKNLLWRQDAFFDEDP